MQLLSCCLFLVFFCLDNADFVGWDELDSPPPLLLVAGNLSWMELTTTFFGFMINTFGFLSPGDLGEPVSFMLLVLCTWFFGLGIFDFCFDAVVVLCIDFWVEFYNCLEIISLALNSKCTVISCETASCGTLRDRPRRRFVISHFVLRHFVEMTSCQVPSWSPWTWHALFKFVRSK